MEAARHLVKRGVAAGFFSRTYIAEDLERKDLTELMVRDLAPIQRGSALVRRAQVSALSPAAEALVLSLQRQADKLGLTASHER